MLMMHTQSKYIKSIFCLGNIRELDRVDQNQCFTLQQFDYNLARMLGGKNELLNATADSMINLTIKVQPDNMMSEIYRAFETDSQCTFSVVFNGSFDEGGSLVGYENALVVTGYMMSLEESFERGADSEPKSKTTQRASLSIKVVMQQLDYLGAGSIVELKF